MRWTFEQTGIAGVEQLAGRLPNEEQKKRGPYAVIECYQEIPCNPCVMSCKFDAIRPFTDINDLPFVDFDKCTGCAVCAGVCPGLAIFIVDESKEGDMGTLTLPYEYWPLPEKGDTVQLFGRSGEARGTAEVLRVLNKTGGRTPLVTLAVQKTELQQVRHFTVSEKVPSEMDVEVDDSAVYDDDAIVCRCEGIRMGEIRALIAAGYDSVDEIKHVSRAGMGPCQGRTCRQIIMTELMRAGVANVDQQGAGSFRPPGGTVSLDQLAKGNDEDAKDS